MRDYDAICDGCGLMMDGQSYQAAEALAHQLGGDTPGCYACGGQDWTFEVEGEAQKLPENTVQSR